MPRANPEERHIRRSIARIERLLSQEAAWLNLLILATENLMKTREELVEEVKVLTAEIKDDNEKDQQAVDALDAANTLLKARVAELEAGADFQDVFDQIESARGLIKPATPSGGTTPPPTP